MSSPGLVVVPSGPGLAIDLRRNDVYRLAVQSADVAIADSGAMVLFWRIFWRRKTARISGLRLLQGILQDPVAKDSGAVFWVHPTEEQRQKNEKWLAETGFPCSGKDGYVAPRYPTENLCDEELCQRLRDGRPKVVVLCIGGGVQERLGYWLRERYRSENQPCPAIICTGAAIGFLSGNQVKIPVWADRLYLGWLFRCLSDPKTFIPRYWSALPLAYLIARYGEQLPPVKR
ncbi:MAG: WecB/TagA/CpsF family glycosyltransferase [Verrucomicrobiota bacterium]